MSGNCSLLKKNAMKSTGPEADADTSEAEQNPSP